MTMYILQTGKLIDHRAKSCISCIQDRWRMELTAWYISCKCMRFSSILYQKSVYMKFQISFSMTMVM